MADHNELGKKGEEIAVGFLQKKGYRILKRNYRFKRHEIDIIALKEDLIIVFEVKTRQSEFLAGPEKTVTRSKQKAIVLVADEFLKAEGYNFETRFDIVSIILNQGLLKIEHLEDAFYPTL